MQFFRGSNSYEKASANWLWELATFFSQSFNDHICKKGGAREIMKVKVLWNWHYGT